MAEAAPHHLELIYQLLVQGTHFWVHQFLVHGQADSKDVNLWERNKTSLDNTFIVQREWMLNLLQEKSLLCFLLFLCL